jgi:hypothetical protein
LCSPSWPMRGRRGGKTGPKTPHLGGQNAAGASPCCVALPWRGKASALFSLYPVVPGYCEMGALRQCPGVRLGPGAASLATRGRSRRLGVVGSGPLAPGTDHKPALLPEEHPRLKPQPNHVPSVVAREAHFFLFFLNKGISVLKIIQIYESIGKRVRV